MSRREARRKMEAFSIFLKMGDYEIEISGARNEVLETLKELPQLIGNIYKAFEKYRSKTTATLTVKTATPEASILNYPKISRTKSCSEAILKILKTDWGKWRPRTVKELREALNFNNLNYPERTLAGVLTNMVKKGKVRRWRTDAGYVYILAEEEALT
ncbi:hypothetical protein J7L49_04970 [Candidatus Bathyarchaeota archaeon]|nr:hypothetical protein [Candidatus Bathyarchaeota archaeon]